MALPEGFNSFEFLQKTYRREVNKRVAKFFKDVGGTDWEPTPGTARADLRIACTHLDNDTCDMTQLRHQLFFDVLGYGRSGLALFYGSRNDIELPVEGHPKVYLYFSQDSASVSSSYPRIDAEYSFRLIDETQATFTIANAKTLANKIKTAFLDTGKGIVFTKGKNIYVYRDPKKGYRLKIYSNSETDAEGIIKKMLGLTDTTYDSDKLSVSSPKRSSESTASTHLVYEVQRRKKRFRPVANVRFRYAYVEIPGKTTPVFLVDTTYKNAALVYP
jgi:hypothetical protein